MARLLPANKGSATVTARFCRAFAADLRNAAAGFEAAADAYKAADPHLGKQYVVGAFGLLGMVRFCVLRMK